MTSVETLMQAEIERLRAEVAQLREYLDAAQRRASALGAAMADPIKLPPLPEPYTGLATNIKEMIRARDLEVARVVLEAAAFTVLGNKHRNATDLELAHTIRALEFKHE